MIPDINLVSPTPLNSVENHELHTSNTPSERQAIIDLDNRYTENFNKVLKNGLQNLQSFDSNTIFANCDNSSQRGWVSNFCLLSNK